jgi:pimeloyl-ACP methyl ester carboxylesterase
MRLVAWLRVSFLVLAALALVSPPAANAAGVGATYTALGGMPELGTRGYMLEVAPPGYPPVHLYAEETGRGPTLLFLHGLGGSGYTLRRLTPYLAATHRVITLDLRGFGRSEKPFDQAYATLDQVAHVKEFIRRRGLDHITLAGHSFGGGVALGLTLDLNQSRPGLISRLILMNAPAFPQPMSRAVGFLRTPIVPYLALNLIPPQITAQMSLSKDMGNFAHITDADVASYASPLREAAAAHALITTAQRIVPENLPDLVRRYPSIRQPTLLVWCRKDPVVPLVTGISLKRMLPHASLRIIDGCTHVPPEEAPDELLLHMHMFLHAGR